MAVLTAAQGADVRDTERTPGAPVTAPPRPPFAVAVPPGSPRVLLLHGAAELAALVQDWEELAREAVEPNPFYEPWLMLPALASFPARFAFALVLEQPHGPPQPGARPLLTGLFPLELRPPSPRVPLPSLAMWRYPHCFLTAPLLRRGYHEDALAAFCDWLAAQTLAPGPIALSKFPGDGPLHQALIEQLLQRGWLHDVERRYTRAVLRHGGDGERYLQEAVPGKRRKEFRRQLRKLVEEYGDVEFADLADCDESATSWTDDFVRLEGESWKGDAGTAFRDDAPSLRFLRAVVQSGYEERRIRFLQLRAGRRPIAAKLNLHSGAGAFAFKIAFDPAYARFSPGVLLELETVQRVARDPHNTWMDSCAAANHPMIDHLWRERRTIEDIAISPRATSDVVLWMRVMARYGRRALRSVRRGAP